MARLAGADSLDFNYGLTVAKNKIIHLESGRESIRINKIRHMLIQATYYLCIHLMASTDKRTELIKKTE
jgi:hypothetical protein